MSEDRLNAATPREPEREEAGNSDPAGADRGDGAASPERLTVGYNDIDLNRWKEYRAHQHRFALDDALPGAR